MAKHLDKFTNAFRNSRIPFLLAEVITDGQGTMVDLACRFANDAAGALLQIPAEELRGQRFTRSFPHQRLQKLRALESVAFSGSAASFIYDTNWVKPCPSLATSPCMAWSAASWSPSGTISGSPRRCLWKIFPPPRLSLS